MRAVWRARHVGRVGMEEPEGYDCGDGEGGGGGAGAVSFRALTCSERILLPNLRGSLGAEIEALRRVGGGCRGLRK